MADEPIALTQVKKIRAALPRQPATASPELTRYLEKVRLHAWKTTTDEVKALLAAGYTEDDIYAATMRTAIDAGIERFEIGLRALKGAR